MKDSESLLLLRELVRLFEGLYILLRWGGWCLIVTAIASALTALRVWTHDRRALGLLVPLLFLGCTPPDSAVSRVVRGPDRHGEIVTDGPNLQGKAANAPVPASMHQRNAGGSDGAGLCVIASAVTGGRYEGQGAAVEKLWERARREPGGYSPEKFDRLAARAAPELGYAHYLGGDYDVLKRWNAAGHPVNVTWSTSSLYGGMPVAHMVTGSHFDDRAAAIIDNNDPGKWYWVPRPEFERRWKGMGGPWALAIERASVGAIAPWLVVAGGVLVGSLVYFGGRPDDAMANP
jgi:hypothetical protein